MNLASLMSFDLHDGFIGTGRPALHQSLLDAWISFFRHQPEFQNLHFEQFLTFNFMVTPLLYNNTAGNTVNRQSIFFEEYFVETSAITLNIPPHDSHSIFSVPPSFILNSHEQSSFSPQYGQVIRSVNSQSIGSERSS